MLPSNHLLKNGRYSIDRSICTGPAGTIYLATDTLRKATVAIIERSGTAVGDDIGSDSLARTQHEGLVRINDDFEDRSCRYSATEPILTSASLPPEDAQSCRGMFDRFDAILLALDAEQALSDTASGVEISPEMFMLTADGKLKLLYPGSTGFAADVPSATSPFAPLESVWETLDHITQKAIYNSYDEASLALLEAPADSRSDLYSLGAIFYKILTGKDPVPAVERSIEMLESNADPLRSPSTLNPVVNSEQSKFIERMLELKRERRFGSIEAAIFGLPSASEGSNAWSEQVVTELEDFPLLELPSTPIVFNAAVPANGFLERPEVPVLEATIVDTAAGFRPPFASAEKVFDPMPTPQHVPAVPKQEFQPKVEPRPEPRPDSKEVFSTYDSAQPAGGGAMKYVAIGAGVLVVAVGIGWATLGGSSAKQADPSASISAPQAILQEQQPIAPSEEPPTIAAEPESGAVETGDNANVSQPAQPKPQIADTGTAKPKASKPGAKNEAKPAKKLTVDDLIN